MSLPPIIVHAAKSVWHWQWNQLMNGLAPSDKDGNYLRPISQKLNAIVPSKEDINQRSSEQLPRLIVGRSCPWAHRTWLVYKLRNLDNSLKLLIAKADHNEGLWKIDPSWMGCKSLIDIYKLCATPPHHRATVPALVDPGGSNNKRPQLLGNESAQLVEALNKWPSQNIVPNLYPKELEKEINEWQNLLQYSVNNGVYRCGFARNQAAYNNASDELFDALNKLDQHLSYKGPWICGDSLTIADIRLFPTLVRWEAIYSPLFGCSKEPLWAFPNLCNWRKRFFYLPEVAETCDINAWRNDYFGALFPLRPNNIIPNGPDLAKIINGET
tara:strand:+ start:2023 stop:3003 length:981 start_codon:yes stop_codon:yes gene_type:complete